ncbi:MAG: Hpt domain-containing protein [Bacteroidales bacterium]|nr:Hpt domain-containing protein [Bacteroidales bacterium]
MEYKFINTDYLNSVADGDSGIVREIVNMFTDQIIEIYNEMMTCFNKKDYHSLGLLAHKAKSSVAIMGMTDLASMLKTFELQAKEGKNSESYRSYIERYKTETEEAAKELDDLVNNRLNKN